MRNIFFLLFISSMLFQQGCVPLAVTGIVATGLAAGDRRSTGIYIEDENVEWKAQARIREKYKDVHVNATSFNLTVLLTGEVSSEEIKKDITQLVRLIPNVRSVINELVVGGNSSVTSRGNDTLITSNVKTHFIGNNHFAAHHIKVVTEAGVVYLMGMVSRAEGDAAADVARNTSGVLRVVKVFEYISDAATK